MNAIIMIASYYCDHHDDHDHDKYHHQISISIVDVVVIIIILPLFLFHPDQCDHHHRRRCHLQYH